MPGRAPTSHELVPVRVKALGFSARRPSTSMLRKLDPRHCLNSQPWPTADRPTSGESRSRRDAARTAGRLREPSREPVARPDLAGILVAIVVGLLLAVPGLHGVADAVADMSVGWLVGGRGARDPLLPRLRARLPAGLRPRARSASARGSRSASWPSAPRSRWAAPAASPSGAWLLVERGGDPRRVAERSAVLFLLTSAINVITLALAGLGLCIGVLPGPAQPAAERRPRRRSGVRRARRGAAAAAVHRAPGRRARAGPRAHAAARDGDHASA